MPRAEDAQAALVPVEAQAGSIIVFESRLWHKTGNNRTADQMRAGVFAWYTRAIYRTQENSFLSLKPEIRQFASEDALVLLGYKTQGLGVMNGASLVGQSERTIARLTSRMIKREPMAFSYDPQIASILLAARAAMGELVPPARGDWKAIRTLVDGQMAILRSLTPAFAGLTITQFTTVTADGSAIGLKWYSKDGSRPNSAVLYIHGGGMISGSVDLYDPVVSSYVAASGVPMLAVDYRLAPEHPHPVPVEDCYAALVWLAAEAEALQIDPARIAVMGDSAGGGIAAGVALLARDRGQAVTRQILIYPMLDDRTTVADPELSPFATWTYDANATGWAALLGTGSGGQNVPAVAAPGRAAAFEGVAPAYIEVGELDIFRDEDIDYARRLLAAGVSAELHVHPGAPHGFDRMAPDSDVGRRAMADRIRVLAAL